MSTRSDHEAFISTRRASTTVGAALERCSLVDGIVGAYLLLLAIAAAAGSGPMRGSCIALTVAMLGVFLVTIVFARGGFLSRRTTAYGYRLVVLGCLVASYFLLRWLLPTVRDASYDGDLLRIDRALFGVEPTHWLEQWVTPERTEWFAFFYLSYFALLAAHLLPMLFLSRQPRLLSEFTLSVVGVWCLGNLLYLVVPGFGPHHHVSYDVPLPRGTIQDFLMATVASAGAQKDIFPSLHTALPTLLFLFAFRNRAQTPWRYTWPVVGFFAGNIVIATVYLRWHWAIDVVAGLVLAGTMSHLGPWLAAREAEFRRARGLDNEWPPLD